MSNTDTQQVLDYWHSIEFFTPFDLSNVVKQVGKTPNFYLPIALQTAKDWEQYSDHTRDAYLLVFDVGQVTQELSRYLDETELSELARLQDEEMAPEGDTCFAKLAISADGIPALEDISVSTLPWAMGKLKQGQLKSLHAEDFELSVGRLKADIRAAWSRQENGIADTKFLSVVADILHTWAGFVPRHSRLAWIKVTGTKKTNSSVDLDKAPQAAELPILNSFYFHDLKLAKQALHDASTTNPLAAYLSSPGPIKLDLDSAAGESHILASLDPADFNAGRWPSDPGQLQSLMQQFALNKMTQLKPGELLSVNGPPGTGKTTLLKDLIADLIVQRATRLAQLNCAADGVSKITECIEFADGQSRTMRRLIPELTGFEIVIASSNNGAVENLSLELPQLEGIATGHKEKIHYFQEVANKYAGTQNSSPWTPPAKPVWGLVSAALGKSANRRRFAGIFGYFAKQPDQKPADSFIKAADVDLDAWKKVGALDYWKFREKHTNPEAFARAKQRFLAASQDYDRYNANQQAIRSDWLRLLTDWETVRTELASLPELEADSDFSMLLKDLDIQIGVLARQAERLEQQLGPRFLRWLLKWLRKTQYQDWLQSRTRVLDVQDLHAALHGVQRLQQKCGQLQLWDGAPLSKPRNQTHAFWQSACYNKRRDELFIAALELHQAFVLETASRAIVGFGDLLNKRVVSGSPLVLWQWLFMLIPVVSSTFASVRRQFQGIGPGSLGWLIVDEAGQAVPQAAVGAILRSKRTVVVGDPLQIEPVVTMPTTLIQKLEEVWFDQKNAEPYSVRVQSVQTLADRAHPYGVRHPHQSEKFIGIPLVMHRRCDNPMFDISNHIAYATRMLHAKDGGGKGHSLLGRSAWFDVQGTCTEGKYVANQGELVLDALVRLYLDACKNGKNALPDVYVITPFREVKKGLMELILSKERWQEKLAEQGAPEQAPPKDLDKWNKNIGTVHTFQGKEADIVFFVLGCDETKLGAIAWAASKPNLLNVAVTRAKKFCYIVGDKSLWGQQHYFDYAADRLQDMEMAGS